MEDILYKYKKIYKYKTKNVNTKNVIYEKNPINQKGGFLNNQNKNKKYINKKNNEDINSSYTSSSDK